MAFRIVSIEHPAEIHIENAQMRIVQDGSSIQIPLSDIAMIVACGPAIRVSTMSLNMLAENGTMVLLLGSSHMPSAMIVPMVANARQSRVASLQVSVGSNLRAALWQRIVRCKIENQARVLAILGLEGAKEVWGYSLNVLPGDRGNAEGAAARAYFQYLHPGLNRRNDDPLNSALNYGYAIVRAMVARAAVTPGFIPAFGIHHRSQLNAFNLADDLVEPFRLVVDLVAVGVFGSSVTLSASQRADLRRVLHAAVAIDNFSNASVIDAIDVLVDSLKAALGRSDESILRLPVVKAISYIDAVRE